MKDLLKCIIQLNRVIRNFNEIDIQCDELDQILTDLTDSFLTSLGFPKDTTVETQNADGTLNPEHPDYFCRDYVCDLIWDTYSPSKTDSVYKKLIKELNNNN